MKKRKQTKTSEHGMQAYLKHLYETDETMKLAIDTLAEISENPEYRAEYEKRKQELEQLAT
ncbi:MAG: hypothetical protein FWG68_11850 [Defluviitaleaceae bacterium]|nr:hypothetical protein [Defluviitaleaceae bacterium]